jgi:hypothetical protein
VGLPFGEHAVLAKKFGAIARVGGCGRSADSVIRSDGSGQSCCECEDQFLHADLPLRETGQSLPPNHGTALLQDLFVRTKKRFRSTRCDVNLVRPPPAIGANCGSGCTYSRCDRELIQDHIGRPVIVRFIPAVPMRRIDLRRDARPEFLMTTVSIIVRNRCCDRRRTRQYDDRNHKQFGYGFGAHRDYSRYKITEYSSAR